MKRNNIVIFIIITLFCNILYAQEFERSRVINKSFAITKQSSLKITNKYGNIMLSTWDKDSVKMSITIRVSDKKECDADARLTAVDVQFTSNPYYLDVQTLFKDNKTLFGVDFKELSSSLFNSSHRVSIDYVVTVPVYTSIEIQNKFGNVYCTDHTGGFNINLSNGDFKGGNLSGQSVVIVNFGNVTLNEVANSRMNLSNAELTLKKAATLHVEGHSTKYSIGSVDALDMDSKRDKFYIDTLKTLNGQSAFSYIQIERLYQSGTLKSNYGDLTITNTDDAFTGIHLNSGWTDIVIGLPPNLTYTLNADYKKTMVTLPLNAAGLKTQLVDEKLQQFHINGTAGPGSTPTATININASGGSFTLRVK
jgi:hypothetical protein